MRFNTAGEFLNIRSLVGSLILVAPFEHDRNVKTKEYGVKDGIRADVVVLSDKAGNLVDGEIHEDVLFMAGKLIGALKRSLGKPGEPGKFFLGVLAEQEPGVPKTPMHFERPSDEQKKHAAAWVEASGFESQPTVASVVAPVSAVQPSSVQQAVMQPATPAVDPAAQLIALQQQLAAMQAQQAQQTPATPAPVQTPADPWATA